MKKKMKIGLALSGGAARGFAHIGVLKAFEERGVIPDVISGASAGAIVGALYADGHSPDEILEMFVDKPLGSFWRFKFPRKGLVNATGLVRILKDNLRARTITDLKIPLYIATTNLNTGKTVYFNQGELLKVVLASASIPVVFSPVEMNGRQYIDGGVTDNLPIKPLKGKVKCLIGVNVNPTGEIPMVDGLIEIALRSFHLNASSKMAPVYKQCDLVIVPHGLDKFGLLDVKKGRKMFELGYRGACEALDDNPKIWK